MSGRKETLGILWVISYPKWVSLISDLHLISSILCPSEAQIQTDCGLSFFVFLFQVILVMEVQVFLEVKQFSPAALTSQ